MEIGGDVVKYLLTVYTGGVGVGSDIFFFFFTLLHR